MIGGQATITDLINLRPRSKITLRFSFLHLSYRFLTLSVERSKKKLLLREISRIDGGDENIELGQR